MLIAEDLLLLLTDDRTGKLAVSSNQVDVALGGAVLLELALAHRVDVAGESEAVRKGRLVVTDASPTSDALLDEALATLGTKQGKKPKDVVTALGKGLRDRLHARLADRGLLREASGKILGIFPTRHWPANDTAHENAVRALLVACPARRRHRRSPRRSPHLPAPRTEDGREGRRPPHRRSHGEGTESQRQAHRRRQLGLRSSPHGDRRDDGGGSGRDKLDRRNCRQLNSTNDDYADTAFLPVLR